MRVTDSYVQRSYLNNNNRALENQLKYQNRVLTQKAFTRASQDSVGANTAMKIRKNLENLDMYDKNLNTAHELFDAAETNLYNIAGNIYPKVNDLVISAQDTKSQMEFDAIALDLEEKAKEMMSSVNCDFGDRQLFAGTSNNKEPFKIKYYMTDEKGNLVDAGGNIVSDPALAKEVPDNRYQALDMNSSTVTYPDKSAVVSAGVKQLNFTDGNGKAVTVGDGSADLTVQDLIDSGVFEYNETSQKLTLKGDGTLKGADTAAENFLNSGFGTDEIMGMDKTIYRKAVVSYNGDNISSYNDPKQYKGGKDGIYIDVGLGVNYDADGKIIPSTAMDVSLNGAKLTGCGTDKDGDSLNIMQLTFDAANALNRGDLETVNRLIDKLAGGQKTVLSGIVTLGTKQNDIDFYLDKNEDYRMNLKEKQNKTEGCDLTTEITNLESAKAAYSAALQIGASTVPNSIFDFIR